jgi:hypothetical protein
MVLLPIRLKLLPTPKINKKKKNPPLTSKKR